MGKVGGGIPLKAVGFDREARIRNSQCRYGEGMVRRFTAAPPPSGMPTNAIP
jgi:hypothetical protein